jgi:hypothetical protein
MIKPQVIVIKTAVEHSKIPFGLSPSASTRLISGFSGL